MSEGAGFHGVIGSADARWLWPESRLLSGAWTRGVPVSIEVTGAGLTISPRARFLRGRPSATSRRHTGRTGGLTIRETFDVTLEVVGSRAAAFRVPAGISRLLPDAPSDVATSSPLP